ncbi:MAG: class I SAM-dependent methyltransferase [Actinomycetota bacterium]|nr:class I SAM-dependent methyltransferase [Actinomycetota bacterium]
MSVDLGKITERQQKVWSTGDFHRIGVGQVVVGEMLVRALHVHAGERVLDVAGGAGNTALAAARRWADVVCSDYVPELLQRAERRAEAEGLPLRTQVADAQQLPFDDGTFGVVTSTFGAMFAPDQSRTASELLRVLRGGGRLGMANWLPQGWAGLQFGLVAQFLPPPPGLAPPSVWGNEDWLRELFGDRVSSLETRRQHVEICYHDTAGLFELFREWFGPVATVWHALDKAQQEKFRGNWIALAEDFNAAQDGTCEIHSDYLEVVAVKA